MSEAGRVKIGFSKPYVAKYSNTGNKVTYSGLRKLARGVDLNIDPSSSDSNDFYADNVKAESASGVFSGGNVTVNVDGLFTAAERFIQGLGEPNAKGWTAHSSKDNAPFVGLGFIVEWMSGGVTTFQPFLLPKVKFNTLGMSAKTQEEEIDWQVQELVAQISRDDTDENSWKYDGDEFATETLAEEALKEIMGFNNPVLSSLTIGSLVLSPEFAADKIAYTATTTDASSVVTAEAAEGITVSIKANNVGIESGDSVSWTLGDNTIEVTATNGEESTVYTVAVTALAKAVLTDIEIGSLVLSPTFDADVDTYTTSTTNAADAVSATAGTGLTVSIDANGSAIESGDSVTWAQGDNTVVIVVSNGVDSKTYTVTVTAP